MPEATTVNPATGEPIETYALLGGAAIEAALDRAEAAFDRHRRTSFAQRAETMRRLGDLLERDAETHAR
ncbi:MAG: aldehyde dehydrogenase family protein, partial [Bacteroidota bacterium]